MSSRSRSPRGRRPRCCAGSTERPSALGAVDLIFGLWEGGDFTSSEWADPAIEWVIADGFEPGHVTGLDGMAAGWRAFVSVWKDYSIEAREYRELDEERVLVFYRRSGHGKTSGVNLDELRADGASLFHIRTGRVTRMVSYAEPDRALAGLGLTSPAPRDES